MTLISGIPPWLIMYFEKKIEKKWQKNKTIFPNLQLIVTGSVNYEPYREKNGRTSWEGKVDIIQTFPASEGFFAFQDDYQKKDFYCKIITEFSTNLFLWKNTEKKMQKINFKNVELNKDYALILTTNSGLWAYSIGDVVVLFLKSAPNFGFWKNKTFYLSFW